MPRTSTSSATRTMTQAGSRLWISTTTAATTRYRHGPLQVWAQLARKIAAEHVVNVDGDASACSTRSARPQRTKRLTHSAAAHVAQVAGVQYILDSVVQSLQQDRNRKFVFAEMVRCSPA